ncbi:alpha/beta fold hydrolase [Kineosporia sp. NBRC 101731]|uniref:thioesterase II family protein n=1 Tax=Kineosporia sp. NBRC 101731 TaxID=3032199 RepID=UPI0024A199A5|nr:alpha/beta fold hydrolase [Kineosporia sp. NBRC 101731]GLY29444.1 thioesterase [Kineosporia sp. NBRC 101731]
MRQSVDVWCRRFRTASAKVPVVARLVCLPHAGGSASFYLPLTRALAPAGIDVLAVQYPGRQDRSSEVPVRDLGVLADRVAEAVGALPGEVPLSLFGHSMGSAVGFEVARRLSNTGRGPARLFVSGRRAPSVFGGGTVHRRDDAGLLAEIRSLDGTAALVLQDEELMRLALPALRADYEAIELYRASPQDTVDCPVTVLTGDADPRTPLEEVAGWATHTTATCEVQVFPGGHFYLSENVDGVAGLLRERLLP